jgi:DoxX-like family
LNTALWILQGLLAFAFIGAGAMKLFTPKAKLVQKGQGWAGDFGDAQVKLLGAAELLGAIGLVVPWATATLPVFTPVAAAALVLLMGGAAMTHVRRKESPVAPVVLAVLAAVVAVGRFGLIRLP